MGADELTPLEKNAYNWVIFSDWALPWLHNALTDPGYTAENVAAKVLSKIALLQGWSEDELRLRMTAVGLTRITK